MENNAEKTVNSSDNVKFILGITLKLLFISTITALLLSGVNALTKDKIAANMQEEKNAAIRAIFPESNENQLYGEPIDGIVEMYMVFSDGTLLGYAASTAPLGFGGAMDLMVGVNSDGTLAGVQLISHSETPGLGNRVGETAYLAQYVGQSARSLDGSIDIITGSTISSEAVLEGVKTALSAYDKIFSENDIFVTGGTQ